MATKAVIEIPVDDAAFRRFVALYHSYSASLEDMPDAWKAINEAMGEATEGLEEGAIAGKEALALAAAQAGLIVENLQDANKAQLSFKRATDSHARNFVELGRVGSGAWKAIGGAADASISKVGSGIAGMAGSILGALGPVGLAAGAIAAVVGGAGAALKGLADAAVTRERSAFSKGITPGQEASFGVYAQQFLGAGALQGAANAQLNLGSTGPLSLLGIDFNDARGLTASDLALKMLRGAVVGAQAHPELPLENIPAIQAYRRLGGDTGDVRNAMKMGLSSLDAASAEEARNAGRLNLNRSAVAQAATFKKAVEGAGVAVQSGAINHLSGADPVLAKIVGAITGDKSAQASIGNAVQKVATTVTKHLDPALKQLQTTVQQVTHSFQGLLPNSVMHSLGIPIGGAATAAVIADVAQHKGIDPTAALAFAIQESGLDPRSKGDFGWFDKAGKFHPGKGPGAHYTSFGAYQLHETGELGNLTPEQAYNPRTNAEVALAEYARVAKLHPNWSPGQIAAAAQRPADQTQYAKDVNAIYNQLIKAQRAARSSKPPIKVSVTNSTASRVDVSMNAAAQA